MICIVPAIYIRCTFQRGMPCIYSCFLVVLAGQAERHDDVRGTTLCCVLMDASICVGDIPGQSSNGELPVLCSKSRQTLRIQSESFLPSKDIRSKYTRQRSIHLPRVLSSHDDNEVLEAPDTRVKAQLFFLPLRSDISCGAAPGARVATALAFVKERGRVVCACD